MTPSGLVASSNAEWTRAGLRCCVSLLSEKFPLSPVSAPIDSEFSPMALGMYSSEVSKISR
jgi:hypothetical protein